MITTRRKQIDNLFSLKGKVAIVTGGNRGLGKAIARGLASVGADLVIAARNEAKTAQAVNGIRKDFGTVALGIRVDLKESNSILALVTRTVDHFGHIDILVNNAGMSIRKLPQDFSVAEWDEVLNTNLRSVFLCSQAVYPAMIAAKGGKIVNISSISAVISGRWMAPYATSKAGIVQLTRSLAVAWARDNIQVNAILPGYFGTDLTKQAQKEVAGLKDYVISRTPVGRWGEPDELIGAAIFLASRASDFVTGVALPVDGGYLAML